MKKITITLAVTFALIETPALAADMAVKSPPPPRPAPVYSWSGFYVGAQAGYSWSNTTVDTLGSAVDTSTADPFGLAGPTAAASAAAVTQSIKVDPRGFIGGL